eukprot:2845360-Pleurochrysis_carterae.AAC.1
MTPPVLLSAGAVSASAAALAAALGRERAVSVAGTRNSIPAPAQDRTKKTASPPGCAGSHWRSCPASSCAPSAAPTASCRNCHARA